MTNSYFNLKLIIKDFSKRNQRKIKEKSKERRVDKPLDDEI